MPADCTGGGSFASTDVDIAKNLALTGTTAGGQPYHLGYWTDTSTVTINVFCIPNPEIDGIGNREFEGIYAKADFVPHAVVTAIVPFTFLFGQLVTSSATINLTLSHNVVVVGL